MANPNPFQLSIAMNGTSKEAMRLKLLEIAKEFETPYGKPCQGTVSQYQVVTKIVTPVWDGKEY